MTKSLSVNCIARSVWPGGRDEISALIREHDWASTPLGAIEDWPQTLRMAVDLVLASPIAAIVLWGPEHLQIYNVLWTKLNPGKHPTALGQRTHDCFSELVDTLAPVYQRVGQGEGVVLTDRLLPVLRGDKKEDAWWNVTYTPVRGGSGNVEGIFCTLAEATDKVLAEGALAEELTAITRVHELTERLLSITDLSAALGEVLDAAIVHYGAERGTIQFRDPDGDVLRYAASRGFDPHDLFAIPPIDRDFHSTCAAAIRTGRRVVACDIQSDPAWADHASTASILGYKAAISTPLKTRREDLQGVLTVHFKESHVPTEPELRWADLYSRLAAHLIEGGRAENALREAEHKHRAQLEEEAAELQVRVAERDALLQEVHHRVKNNLHVITSMLEMQSRRTDDFAVGRQLEEARNRVMSIAQTHELLYQSVSFSAVDLTAYAARLVPHLVSFYNMQNRVQVVTEGESVRIDLDRAVPCGLLLNELVSNACKHPFPNGETGRIKVLLKQTDEWVHLTVQDSGVGLSPDFDFSRSETLGLTIVRLLIAQLGGHLSLRNGNGTCAEMQFLASGKKDEAK